MKEIFFDIIIFMTKFYVENYNGVCILQIDGVK